MATCCLSARESVRVLRVPQRQPPNAMIAVSAATAVAARVTDAATGVVIAMVDAATSAVEGRGGPRSGGPGGPRSGGPGGPRSGGPGGPRTGGPGGPRSGGPGAAARRTARPTRATSSGEWAEARGERATATPSDSADRQPPTISPHSPRSRRIQLRRLKPTNPTRST